MATINGVEVIGDKTAHDFDLLDKNDGVNLANGVERNREATEDNHQDIVLHRTDTDVHVTPAWKNSLVTKEILGLYWTAAQTADIINEISIAGGAKLVKVDELPETGKEQTIYLVPKTDPQERDIFDEFVWIDGKFEFIGTTKVDLSNYATKTELNAKQDALSAQQLSNIADVVNKANASDLTAHTNNADIHVTTSDKANWNAKQDALSNQQLSNIADVTNKANNADVVHKTGDETIDGVKTFNLPIQSTSSTRPVIQNNSVSLYGISSSFIIRQTDNNDEREDFVIDKNRNLYISNGNLGTPTQKWKTINGVEPSDLSLPSNTSINIDTTGFTWGTNFTFTPSVNGHLFIGINGFAGIIKLSLKTGRGEYYLSNQTGGLFRYTVPVYKGKIVTILVASTAAETVGLGLSLFTLQGNV